MTEQELFEQYKAISGNPDLTIEEYRARVNRWQPVSSVNIVKEED